jgi:hypothetical protein
MAEGRGREVSPVVLTENIQKNRHLVSTMVLLAQITP